MKMFIILIIYLSLFIFSSHSLVCPIYNVYNNESSPIESCIDNSSQCTYWNGHTSSSSRRCLGIYTFDNNMKNKEHRIRIRQLAVVDDLEMRYVNRTQCFLDIDRTGQNLLCRCNSDNCTLKWQTAENFPHELFQRRDDF